MREDGDGSKRQLMTAVAFSVTHTRWCPCLTLLCFDFLDYSGWHWFTHSTHYLTLASGSLFLELRWSTFLTSCLHPFPEVCQWETFGFWYDSCGFEQAFLSGVIEEALEEGIVECIIARNHHFVEALAQRETCLSLSEQLSPSNYTLITH